MTIRNRDNRLPVIPEALMKALDERFPERCPDPTWPDRDIWMDVGRRAVIRFLLSEFKRQNENILIQEES